MRLVFLIGIFTLATMAFGDDDVTYVSDKSLWTAKAKISDITGLQIPDDWQEHGDFVPPTVGHLPAKFDWRTQVTQVPKIVNQGSCGSCWAFGTTAILNWSLAIQNVNADISEQEILSCSGKGSCMGGYLAHDYQFSPGSSLESEFPYVAKKVKCKAGLSSKFKIKRWGYVGQKNRKPTTDEIKAAIMEYGPVAVTVAANFRMQSYRGGVFNSCSFLARTNHVTHLVGWNDDEKAWIMGNSWGQSWGEQGYMRIKYGCQKVGEIASFIVTEPQ